MAEFSRAVRSLKEGGNTLNYKGKCRLTLIESLDNGGLIKTSGTIQASPRRITLGSASTAELIPGKADRAKDK